MNRNTFNTYINEADFRGLFLMELGWNKPKGNPRLLPIVIDETEYQFICVAERNGLQVIVADVENIPSTSLARRIDAQLRKQAQDYIAIYKSNDTNGHHAWVVPVKNVDKRDLVSIEYESPSKADFLLQKLDCITFDPTETTTIVDVKEGVHRAFAVNAEKITKDFYSGFKKEHTAFANFISGIDDNIAVKENRNKQWYASVMLNRLMFCYFIQKKGFLDGNVNYLREKLEWVRKERGEDRFFGSFYKEFLTRLFADGLNAPQHDRDFVAKFGRIPYLNGGMFDHHQIERDYADIDIADDAFISLFTFFDKWQWHLDTRVTASGRDINPDVLGYIFEQYINDRAAMGAYYTKEDITEYIGRSTILPFLFDKVAKSSDSMKKLFAPNGWVCDKLRESGERYIFDAVKYGYTPDWRERIPSNIAIGLDTTKPELLERRKDWNTRTPEPWALPTEIWRETIERLQRCESILGKIKAGEVASINDFITYNLDIRSFADDLITAEDAPQAFVYNFYNALRSVTILDPTCGSGAFLFAAMSILEPLYYDCINKLESYPNKSEQTKAALQEIKAKYRSNIHYFIFKSIILRNLYGVDIMAEATEIAKLRLFLKMVAVVDVDYRADNLGLDPLPDIDFNIRCGNTLVGYANADSVYADHQGDLFAAQEYRDTIEAEMNKVSIVFKVFKHLQLTQEADKHEEFIAAKKDLSNRLIKLNDTLNHHLYNATASNIPYDKWLKSHQPLNWIAEFYDIIHGNGGFDVVIGNPPYVTFTDSSLPYSVSKFATYKTKNLFALVGERCNQLICSTGSIGYIIPLSGLSIDGFTELQKIIYSNRSSWNSFYSGDRNPSELFEGVKIRAGIYISRPSLSPVKYVSKYIKYYSSERSILFCKIVYTQASQFVNAPKLHTQLGANILNKLMKLPKRLESEFSSEVNFYYHAAPIYWNKALYDLSILECQGLNIADSYKKKSISKNYKDFAFLLINSSLFFYYWIVMSDCYNLTQKYIAEIKVPTSLERDVLHELADNLNRRLNSTIQIAEYTYKNKGTVRFAQFFPKKSKSLIDEIDKALAKHYGFTEEELDFIINYDIKYRMGDDLNTV
ncbi:DNA methyltransferase [uncultured Duncaniella sp.]|uniref:Eco57I restriction-modification methylase domain-containing protein n=1 Tax=uncultured Duncaniella sp. TaxID=2768039 RepID=UPI0025B24C73|nr:DNA methyltransferase [uncultured Duncaniella sp.]